MWQRPHPFLKIEKNEINKTKSVKRSSTDDVDLELPKISVIFLKSRHVTVCW